jgi:hypothetical protein
MCILSNHNYPFTFCGIRNWPSDDYGMTQLSDMSDLRVLFATISETILHNTLRDSDLLWLLYLARYREYVCPALGMHTSERPLTSSWTETPHQPIRVTPSLFRNRHRTQCTINMFRNFTRTLYNNRYYCNPLISGPRPPWCLLLLFLLD